MKKLMIGLAMGVAMLTTGCKGGMQLGNASEDSLAVFDTIAAEDLKPAFLYYHDPDHMEMFFWDGLERTEDSDSTVWALQACLRRHEKEYTRMFVDGNVVNIKFRDELLKDPDGKELQAGDGIHRKEIPTAGIRYEFENMTDTAKMGEYSWGMHVVTTEEYLKTHKALKVESSDPWEDDHHPFKAEVLQQLEKKYDMKVQRSVVSAKIDGGRYLFGAVQFKPKNKRLLALQVLVEGDKMYVCEEEGNYSENEYESGWNVDDGGIYIASSILAAFEGPEGLLLCYEHSAPESHEIGYMTPQKDGSLDVLLLSQYYHYMDEDIPMFHKDMEQLEAMLAQSDAKFKGVKLTKWNFIDLTDDEYYGTDIWVSNDEGYGAIFLNFNHPNRSLFASYGPGTKVALYEKAVMLTDKSKDGKQQIRIVTWRKGERNVIKELVEEGQEESEWTASFTLDGEPITYAQGMNCKGNALQETWRTNQEPYWHTFRENE